MGSWGAEADNRGRVITKKDKVTETKGEKVPRSSYQQYLMLLTTDSTWDISGINEAAPSGKDDKTLRSHTGGRKLLKYQAPSKDFLFPQGTGLLLFQMITN